MAEKSSGPIQAEVKVALLLRLLAGASYHDLCLLFDIPSSSVYDLFHRTLEALLSSYSLPGLPTGVEELRYMALRFQTSRSSGSPIMGCVRALYGIATKIRNPSSHYHPALYYCRKGFYAIPVQAMVDAEYRFRVFSAVCVGATHDSLAFSVSALDRYLSEGRLPSPFWISADEAYVCTECLLTPFSSSGLDSSILSKYKDAFNFYHSSLRMHVEQSFGQLVERFGILWRPLRFSLGTNVKIVLATMILHNFCIDHCDGALVHMMSLPEKALHRRAFAQWYRSSSEEYGEQICNSASALVAQLDRGMAKSQMRATLVERLRAIGRFRPYAQHRFDQEPEEGGSDNSQDRE